VTGRSYAELLDDGDSRIIPITSYPFSPFTAIMRNHGDTRNRNIMMSLYGIINDVTDKDFIEGPSIEFHLVTSQGSADVACSIQDHMTRIKELYNESPGVCYVTLFHVGVSVTSGRIQIHRM
jgi:hypothetical protein